MKSREGWDDLGHARASTTKLKGWRTVSLEYIFPYLLLGLERQREWQVCGRNSGKFWRFRVGWARESEMSFIKWLVYYGTVLLKQRMTQNERCMWEMEAEISTLIAWEKEEDGCCVVSDVSQPAPVECGNFHWWERCLLAIGGGSQYTVMP